MTLIKFNRLNPTSQCASQYPMSRWQKEFEQFFSAPFGRLGSPFPNVWAPALDLSEDKENLYVSLEVPGMKKEDLKIELHDGVLSVSGDRRLEERGKESSGYRTERFSGQFQRSIALPKAVLRDQAQASYKDGILTVTLPIAAEARPKQITVNSD